MLNTPPLNFDKIDEMTDGDADFKAELITAIYNSLVELRDVYIQGAAEEDEETIQEIRHKVKPSLAMFEVNPLNDILSEGKEVIETSGFGPEFLAHFEKFLDAVQEAIDFVEPEFKKIAGTE
ncbi:hypothetical protein [Cecembia sp.]|uniref:hypothetical protein n=1 Tax=Cecembia sp. TaxID=1898110 RepID=UPI0025C52026|nr:hypothetical protein [Cecembia sp.]